MQRQRYFFHLRNSAGKSLDEAGILLPDRESAVREAMEAARSIMRTPADATVTEAWRGWQIEVVDDQGTPILVLPFRSALLTTPQGENHPPESRRADSRLGG